MGSLTEGAGAGAGGWCVLVTQLTGVFEAPLDLALFQYDS